MKYFYMITTIFLIGLSCAKKDSEEKIIARIGDKTISVQELMSRAEFTVRPRIFNSKISVLNNLIAEKLIALDAGKNDKLSQSEQFQAYIKGIQEQYMREQLYYQEAYNKVEIDTTEIKENYKLAGREYDLAFYFITDHKFAEKIKQRIQSGERTVEKLFEELEEDRKAPRQKVKWKDPEHLKIHKALFSKPLKQDTIIGPLQIESDGLLIMKVLEWKDYPIIGGEEALIRYKEVAGKIRETKASINWNNYVKTLMKGKEVKFEPKTYKKLEKYFFSLDKATDPDEKMIAHQNFWKSEIGDVSLNGIEAKDVFMDSPFFRIDEEVWTVRDFQKALMSHPLVYRKGNISSKDFGYHFRAAIIDLIRDQYLNKDAYQKALDQNHVVKRNVTIWQDALLALYHGQQYIKSIMKEKNIDAKDMKTKDNYFQVYIDSLFTVYKSDIEINTRELEKVKLTTTNMYAVKQFVPYPMVVPAFPQLTVKDRLKTFLK